MYNTSCDSITPYLSQYVTQRIVLDIQYPEMQIIITVAGSNDVSSVAITVTDK